MAFAVESPAQPELFDSEIYIASRFLRFMVMARNHWQGDLDRHLISMCFLVLKYSTPAFRKSLDGQQTSLSIQSLSDMTGIPRESVRRKVDVMLKMGDLKLDDQDMLTAGESTDSVDVVKEIMGYINRLSV